MIPRPPPSTLFPYTTLFRSDPWIGTSQLNDMVLVSPIFHRGRIVGYAANIAHSPDVGDVGRSEEHTSELQSRGHLVCRLLLEKKKQTSLHTTLLLHTDKMYH